MANFYRTAARRNPNPSTPERQLSRGASQRIARRKALIEQLITELEAEPSGITFLYCSLAACELTATDASLLHAFGHRLTGLTTLAVEVDKRKAF